MRGPEKTVVLLSNRRTLVLSKEMVNPASARSATYNKLVQRSGQKMTLESGAGMDVELCTGMEPEPRLRID
jgi:hypothetical protein